MFAKLAGMFKGGGAGAAGGAAGGGMGGLKGFGERLGNFGVSDATRGQMGEDAYKKFRSDQLWNMGAALQGQEGGRDPNQHLPTAAGAMQNLDMNQMPYQMGQGGMMGQGFGLNFGRGRGQRGGGLLDMGGY